jgi:trehalose 6-phosphate phosphatase
VEAPVHVAELLEVLLQERSMAVAEEDSGAIPD